MHEFLNANQRFVDLLTFTSAAVAISSTQFAVWLSCLAALVSVVLGLFRLHDRIKYGPARGRE